MRRGASRSSFSTSILNAQQRGRKEASPSAKLSFGSLNADLLAETDLQQILDGDDRDAWLVKVYFSRLTRPWSVL